MKEQGVLIMKRLLAVVLVCSLVLSMSTISVKADDNVEQKAMQIYQEMLEESGLITSNQSIVLRTAKKHNTVLIPT